MPGSRPALGALVVLLSAGTGCALTPTRITDARARSLVGRTSAEVAPLSAARDPSEHRALCDASGCDDVRVVVGEGVVTALALRSGVVVASHWKFVATSPRPLPRMQSKVREPRKFTVLSSSGAYGARTLPDAQVPITTIVRHVAWEKDGIRWSASVLCPWVTSSRGAFPSKWREWLVTDLQQGPAVVVKGGAEPLPDLVGRPSSEVSGEVIGRVPCRDRDCERRSLAPVALRDLGLRVVSREIEVAGESIERASWVFEGTREDFRSFAPLDVVGGSIPEEAVETSSRDPWELEDVRDFYFRTLRFQRNGATWDVEVFTPPIRYYDPKIRTMGWRTARRWEWRVVSVSQAALDGPPASPRATSPANVSSLEEPIAVRYEGAVGEPFTPRPRKRVEPKYPPYARNGNEEGVVVLQVVVSPAGDVTEVVLVHSDPMFDATSLWAVGQWEFEPVSRDGRGVWWRSNVNLSFRLR